MQQASFLNKIVNLSSGQHEKGWNLTIVSTNYDLSKVMRRNAPISCAFVKKKRNNTKQYRWSIDQRMKELEAIQISRPPLSPQGNNQFSLRNAFISGNKERAYGRI